MQGNFETLTVDKDKPKHIRINCKVATLSHCWFYLSDQTIKFGDIPVISAKGKIARGAYQYYSIHQNPKTPQTKKRPLNLNQHLPTVS